MDDPASRDTPDNSRGSDAELSHLREILVGPERKELAHLQSRVDRLGFTPERLAEELPAAIFRRSDRDRQLAVALGPTVEQALSESVRRHPRMIATAIFPVLGPAIRKAIAQALSGLVASVNTGLGQAFSWRGLKWRLEAWRTGVPFAQVVISHSMLYRVEQVLLIHAESGLLLEHVSLPDLVATDADLISGMMTAIRDFVGDSFAAEREVGGLTSFKVGELEVVVEPGPQAIIAAVVRGPAPPSLLERLRETIESIHLRFADALIGFQGDTKALEPSRELLEDLLETVLQPEHAPSGKRVVWWPWLVAFLLLVSALGFLQWRRTRAWAQAVDRVDAEPGIVVVHQDQGWRRSTLSGLRDPLAARPAALLAALGTDTTRIDGQWQPYVSLDSLVVVERARRQLGVPSTVTLALVGDTLKAGGAATMKWVSDINALRMFPPGVSHIDAGDVEPQLPAHLTEMIDAIEQRRALFAVASSRLSPLALAAVDSSAQDLIVLDEALSAVGRHVELELAGRADASGLDSANHSLSADRAEVVRQALIRGGVPGTSVTTHWFGASAPLEIADTMARARMNRSVSFVVKVVRNERSIIPR